MEEREVAGIRCGAVLADLGEYVDGALDAAQKARIDAHLAGCDQCERFGGAYAETVRAVRARARPATVALDEGLLARLVRATE